MRALQITAVHRLEMSEIPEPQPSAGEAVVTLRAAALNHREVWMKSGEYAGMKWPTIPGSDGAGVVGAVGEGVDPGWIGREVIINPGLNWGDDERAQGDRFSILGLPHAGTLAEKVVVPAAQLTGKPSHLSWVEAAALPVAGLTAWRALSTRGQVKNGERVLITGIGGGVALLALQFAVPHGAEIWVTSSSDEKIARAVALGAKGGANYKAANWVNEMKRNPGGFDLVIDGAGGNGFDSLVELTAPGGRIVVYGATHGNPPSLSLRRIFWRQIGVLGCTMGSPADWWAMTSYCAQYRLKPIVSDVLPFERAAEAFALLERGGQFGKIVVTMSKLPLPSATHP